ncbi:MAG: DUF4349 domain-containing protein [Fimbriimonadales bacterium]
MMSSPDIYEDLKAYFDGELSLERAEVVRAALESDAELRKEYEFITRTSDSLRAMTIGPVPKAIPTGSASRGRTLKLAPTFAMFAAACLVVFASVAVLRNRGGADEMSKTVASDSDEMKSIVVPERSLPATESSGGAGTPGAETGVDESKDAAPAIGGYVSKRAQVSPRLSGDDELSPERTIVKTGSLRIRVASVAEAEDRISKYVKKVGGFVESSSSSEDQVEPSSEVTIRIPVAKFDDAIRELSSFGVRLAKNVTGEDVTKQVVDMAARLKTLQAQEQTYRKILGSAKTVGQVLEVESYLVDIRTQIEVIQADLKSLKSMASMSKIVVGLEQSAQAAKNDDSNKDDWAGEAWGNSVGMLGNAMKGVGTGIIYLFTFSPIWIPILIGLFILTKLATRAAKA